MWKPINTAPKEIVEVDNPLKYGRWISVQGENAKAVARWREGIVQFVIVEGVQKRRDGWWYDLSDKPINFEPVEWKEGPLSALHPR
jgi:hypothetical protein